MNHRIVTVFGGTGFLGRRVVRHLRNREFFVRIARASEEPLDTENRSGEGTERRPEWRPESKLNSKENLNIRHSKNLAIVTGDAGLGRKDAPGPNVGTPPFGGTPIQKVSSPEISTERKSRGVSSPIVLRPGQPFSISLNLALASAWRFLAAAIRPINARLTPTPPWPSSRSSARLRTSVARRRVARAFAHSELWRSLDRSYNM
jgi:hypothetical protein